MPCDVERVPLLSQDYNQRQPANTTKPWLFQLDGTSVLFAVFLGIYCTFLVAGALMFSVLESPVEIALRAGIDEKRRRFLLRYPEVLDHDLEQLIAEVVKASNKGISVTGNGSTDSNWSFAQSLFFSSTVATTIGYGNVTPLSKSGKMFCMLFALIGIPMTLVLLSATVQRLKTLTTWLLNQMYARLIHIHQPFVVQLLHFLIIVGLILWVLLLIPAAIFTRLEPNWTYLDGFYYCFISLTTIGLGDYVPGDASDQSYRSFYKLAVTIYLLIGITFIVLILDIFNDIPQLNIGAFLSNKSKCECRNKLESARSSDLDCASIGIKSNLLKVHHECQSKI